MDLDAPIGGGVMSIPSESDIVVGNLFMNRVPVKYHSAGNLGVIIYASPWNSVRILHSTGKCEWWDYDAFRSLYRRVE